MCVCVRARARARAGERAGAPARAFACPFVRVFVFSDHLSFIGELEFWETIRPVKHGANSERNYFIEHCSSSHNCIKDCML